MSIEYTEWVNYSEKDFIAAQFLMTATNPPIEIICYHCQQSAEKLFKAFLIKNDIIPSRTHDLNLLVNVGFNKEVAENCALYWSRKSGSLAKLIDKADQMSADQIAEMGRSAKKRVAEEYTWDKICGQYENVFVGK